MVKFLKLNKAVVVLNCLVTGISKYLKKVIRKDSSKKTVKKSRVKAFIKLVNYNHIMLTRWIESNTTNTMLLVTCISYLICGEAPGRTYVGSDSNQIMPFVLLSPPSWHGVAGQNVSSGGLS
ncbi:hypothetical protein M8C21_014660 [Ambrosia artemisiifolia]|uniref:Uncharacterized protein n=1 Tax=Ambrosia artemisiifolia TaxID=4212 RepID=A0AAD5DCR8_AMBAR|nr:hypothetical protein M8C21_014660 [Ambrosia artemisiifolia]